MLYRVIKSPQDRLLLQQDLNRHLVQWTYIYLADGAKHWEICINYIYQITCFNHISEHALEIVDQHDYLSVNRLHSSMTWSYHIQLKNNKATKVLNLIKHTLHRCPIKKSKNQLSRTIVLEYAEIIWDPHQKYLIDNYREDPMKESKMHKQRFRHDSGIKLVLNNSRLTMFYI